MYKTRKTFIILLTIFFMISCNNTIEKEIINNSTINECEMFNVKFYYYQEQDLFSYDATGYYIEAISLENLPIETKMLMEKYNGIKIDNIWYEGKRICVDLNINEINEFNKGSAAGAIRLSELLKTFSSFPNVNEIEILIAGEKGCIGDHFMFDQIFFADEWQ